MNATLRGALVWLAILTAVFAVYAVAVAAAVVLYRSPTLRVAAAAVFTILAAALAGAERSGGAR